ncbi:MAG: hypothetical protein WCK32_08255 [Chlorobiaceae bacterium]
MSGQKKAGGGQATGKEGYLLGANNGHCLQPKYTHPASNLKAFNTTARKRAMVESNGQLLCRNARRAGL